MDENDESSGPNKYRQTKSFSADEPVKDSVQQSHGTDLTKIFKQVKVRETAQSPSASGASNDPRDATDFFAPVTPRPARVEQGSARTFQSPETNTASSAAESVPSLRGAQHHHHSSPQAAAASSPAIEGLRGLTRDSQRPEDQKSRTADGTQRNFYDKPASPRQVDGGFTQLLRSLSSEDNDELPLHVPAPVAQPLPEGPGEFTRIVSRSALRAAADRERQERAQQANDVPDQYAHPMAAPPPAASVDLRQFIAKEQPLASMTGNGTLASLPAEQAASAATSPDSPAVASHAPQSQLHSGGRLQQYVPLLLIANLFALFLLMMLLFLVLLRHR